jgi:spore germination cell wall hydrolase CwlJ-like protein
MKKFIATTLLLVGLPLSAMAGDCPQDVAPNPDLVCNIYHESRGEGIIGMLAVAHVTLNRVESGIFPDTIERVVWERGPQFSWTQDGKSDAMPEADQAVLAEAAAIIALTLHETGQLGELTGLTDDTYWFHNGSVTPYWARRFHKVTRIGGHTFYEKS